MKKRNISHGKIHDLPEPVKDELHESIVKGKTLMEMEGMLKDKGHDISYSSVGRYRKEYMEKFDRLRMARDYARIIAEDNVDRPSTELHEANNAIISNFIMETLVDDTMSSEDKIKAAQAISALQRAQIANEKLKIDARKSSGVIHTAMNLLKAKIFEEIGTEHPELAAAIVRIADEVENDSEIVM